MKLNDNVMSKTMFFILFLKYLKVFSSSHQSHDQKKKKKKKNFFLLWRNDWVTLKIPQTQKTREDELPEKTLRMYLNIFRKPFRLKDHESLHSFPPYPPHTAATWQQLPPR